VAAGGGELSRGPGEGAFLPVRIVGSLGVGGEPTGGLEVLVRGGRRIRLLADFDVETLVKVVADLENLPC